jgi:alpha-glucosidase
MAENIPDPNLELMTAKLLQVEEMIVEDEEFHHLNNPADGIKPIVKKYLGTQPRRAIRQ